MVFSIQDEIEDITDYVEESTDICLKANRLFLEQMENIYALEEYIIESSLINGFVTEETKTKVIERQEKRGILDRIIDAFKALFGRFTKKLVLVKDRNDYFFKNTLPRMKASDIQGLTLNCAPYWSVDHNAQMTEFQRIVRTLINKAKGDTEGKKVNETAMSIVGGNADTLKQRCLEKFAVSKRGKKPIKVIENYSTNHFREKDFSEMKTYLTQCDKILTPQIKNITRVFEVELKNLSYTSKENEPDKNDNDNEESQKESFCFLENCSYNDTILAYLPNYNSSIVLEADNNNSSNNNNNNNNDKPQGLASASVTQGSNSDDDNKNKSNEETAKKRSLNDLGQTLLSTIQVIEGALLMVLESKYQAILSLFKFAASKKGYKTDADDDDDRAEAEKYEEDAENENGRE